MPALFRPKTLFLLVLNVVIALIAAQKLGHPAAWLGPEREAAGSMLGDGLPLAQLAAFAFLLSDLIWTLAARRGSSDPAVRIPRLALHMLSFIVYGVIAAASVSMVFHQSLAGIMGASGVLGLVIGFAMRGLVSDVFSGVALQFDRSLRLGDWVEFHMRGRDYSGRLLEIDWRTTHVLERSEAMLLVPNSEFAHAIIANRSRPGAGSEYACMIELDAEQDHVRVMEILALALQKPVSDGLFQAQPAPYVRLASVKDGAASFRLYYFIDPQQVSSGKASSAALTSALQFLKSAGIPVIRMQHTDVLPSQRPGDTHHDHLATRLAVLASVPMLALLTQEELAQVAEAASTVRLPADYAFIRAGEAGDCMYVVSEGSLEVSVGEGAAADVVGRLWPGDCFGEMSLLTGAPRSANVSTMAPAVLLKIDKAAMTDVLAGNASLVERLAAVMAVRAQANTQARDRSSAVADEAHAREGLRAAIRRFFRLA